MERRFPRWAPWAAGVVGGALVLVGEFVPIRSTVEDALTSRSVAALESASLGFDEVAFSGRDGVVSGVASADVERAENLVKGLEGVRVVDVISSADADAAAQAEDDAAAKAEDDAVAQADADAAARADADAAARAEAAAAAAQAEADAQAKRDADAAAAAAAVAAAIANLPSVQFETASAVLTPASATVLDAMASALLAGPGDVVYEVRGHTDSSGDAAANQVLSEQRASAVIVALVARGVPAGGLAAVGLGEIDPLVSPEATEADRAANRRVVVVPRSSGA